MTLLHTLLLSSSLSVLQIHAWPSGRLVSRQSPAIQWGLPCVVELDIPVDCGTLVVPLDYTNASDTRTVNLELIRYKSTRTPFRGSILTHWGGPGPSGREDFEFFAPQIAKSVRVRGAARIHTNSE